MLTLNIPSTIKSIASVMDYSSLEKIVLNLDKITIDTIDVEFCKYKNEIYGYLENHILEKTEVNNKINSMWNLAFKLNLDTIKKIELVSEVYNRCRLLSFYFNR